MSYRRLFSYTVLILVSSACLSSGREYKILYPSGKLVDGVNEGVSDRTTSSQLGAPAPYLDTLIYDDMSPYWYFIGLAEDTAVVWFTCPSACSLFAVQYVFRSILDTAYGGIWDALSEYVPGNPEFFDCAGGGDCGLGSTILYPFPVVSDWVDLTPFGGPFDLDTSDFFVGFVWTRDGDPEPYGDIRGDYTPARSQMWSTLLGGWTNLGQTSDLFIRALVIVYGNPPPEIQHSKLPDTYSTSPRSVDAFITDLPDSIISEAWVYYRINGGSWDSTGMTGLYPDYSGILPGAAVGDTVEYYIRACDDQPLCEVNPLTAPTLNYIYLIRAGTPGACVLYVDEGDGELTEYTTALDNALSGSYDVWMADVYGDPDGSVINFGYNAIVWGSYSGFGFGRVVAAGDIQTYLDGGGNLWLAGQDIPDGGLGYGFGNYTTNPGEFASDYLRIMDGVGNFLPSGDTACENLFGATGDTITEPYDGGFNYWPWWYISDNFRGTVNLLSGGVPIIYDLLSNVSGHRVDSTFKVIFNYWQFGSISTTCDTLAIPDVAIQTNLMKRTLEWFGCAVTGVEEGEIPIIPESHFLSQNSPNPVRRSTEFRFGLPNASDVSLKVYDITGSLVKELHSGEIKAGSHAIHWDLRNGEGSHVASGIYFYRLSARGLDESSLYTATRKMVVLK
jgi:hypothetical protein